MTGFKGHTAGHTDDGAFGGIRKGKGVMAREVAEVVGRKPEELQPEMSGNRTLMADGNRRQRKAK